MARMAERGNGTAETATEGEVESSVVDTTSEAVSGGNAALIETRVEFRHGARAVAVALTAGQDTCNINASEEVIGVAMETENSAKK